MIVVLFIVSVLLFIVGFIILIEGRYITGILVMVVGGLCLWSFVDNVTKQDVIDGKAYYQEAQIITGNDTIKIYDIVWKQKN